MHTNVALDLATTALDRRTLVRGAFAAGAALIASPLLMGCAPGAGDAAEGASDGSADAGADAPNLDRAVVVYFTCPEPTGTDTVAGASRVVRDGVLYGNVELVANLIAQGTGADLFAIETVQEYPADHDELIAFGVAEQEAGTLPELATALDNLDDYDTVFLGHPIWNAQLPMPVRSFLEQYDLSGKTIVPFTVHGGSGFARTREQVAEAEPQATVWQDGFSVSRNAVGECDDDLNAWLEGLGADPQAAASAGDSAEEGAATEQVDPNAPVLVAYFSHTGNTEEVAQLVHDRVGGDLFQIVPEVPYPDGMSGAASVAEAEHDEDARPAVASTVDDMDSYGTVFLGYPIWYGTLPMVVATFLESYDFGGKVIVPFCTSSGGGIDESVALIAQCAPGAGIAAGLRVSDNADIDPWLASMGF